MGSSPSEYTLKMYSQKDRPAKTLIIVLKSISTKNVYIYGKIENMLHQVNR